MQKAYVVVACVGILVVSGCRQHDVAAEVAARERQVEQSFNSGNAEMERDLVADDFVGIEADGSRYDKAKAVGMVSEFNRSGYKFSTDGVTVQRVREGVAIAHGFDHYQKPDRTPLKTGVWTDVWVWRDGAWRLVASQDGWMGR